MRQRSGWLSDDSADEPWESGNLQERPCLECIQGLHSALIATHV